MLRRTKSKNPSPVSYQAGCVTCHDYLEAQLYVAIPPQRLATLQKHDFVCVALDHPLFHDLCKSTVK